MEIAVPIANLETENLQLCQQLGVRHAIVMQCPATLTPRSFEGKFLWFEDLLRLKSRLECFGLKVEAIENLPEHHWHNVRVPGNDAAREEELKNVHESLRNMSRVGIPILGYNWMPDGVWGHWRNGLAGGGTRQRRSCEL